MNKTITDETMLDCGHKPSPHREFTTGYGLDEKGRTFCYSCAAPRFAIAASSNSKLPPKLARLMPDSLA